LVLRDWIAEVRIRIALSKADDVLVVNKVRTLSKNLDGLRAGRAQLQQFCERNRQFAQPSHSTDIGYVAELQALNVALASKRLTKAHF